MPGKPRPKVRYWLRLVSFFLVTLYLAAIFVLPFFVAVWEIRPAQSDVCCQTPADFGLTYQSIEFKTTDGITLRGWYVPSQNGATVIALHGYGGNRLGVLEQAAILAKHGYGVLLYDERASGESEGESLSWGWRDVPDASNAVTFLKTLAGLDPNRIGIYGCSTGAEISLAATALAPSIAAVASEDAEFTSIRDLLPARTLQDFIFWPINPLFIKFMEWRSGTSAPIALSDAVQQIAPRPVFFISSGQTYDYWQAQYYFDRAGEPKSLWNVPEASHCMSVYTRPEEYENRLVQFFDSTLLSR
jgi:fermentation-respiration switch protein FrsA (DUF1100 family)